ncbi:O-antigen ligase family protein [Jatrophihabitans sp.]|uniref:O-antigen ligase family protein n=1 Tax=Jatrophihabitans sp. TaxID=1932789 RepID=UPI0030C6E346|nr:hypothetical protein [Jatrophihabitans sp.]
MIARRSGFAVLVLLGGGLLLLEAVTLRSTGIANYAGIAIIVLTAGLIIVRSNLVKIGIWSAVGAAFTLPWNGIIFGGLRPGDGLILISLAAFISADIRGSVPRSPGWIRQLTYAILIVAVVHVFAPVDKLYVIQRVIVGANGVPTVQIQSNLGVAFKFIVGIAVTPLAFSYAVRHQPKVLRWLPTAMVLGTAVSGFIAFSDGLGVTHLGTTLTHVNFQLAREGGLTKHPNYLAASCILALPIALWMAAQANRRMRYLGIIGAIGVTLGDYATGSRGGAVCIVLGGAFAFALIPYYRKRILSVALAAGIAAAVIFAVVPGAGNALLKATRLGGGTTATAGSNAVRALVGAQGVRDFKHSPIFGIGLQVADQAQNVYLQELASGGLLLFVAMLVYALGNLRLSISLMRYYDIAGALVACALSSAVFNYLEADLTDRFFYVPEAIAAMLYTHWRSTHVPETDAPITLRPDSSGSGLTLAERVRLNLDKALVGRAATPLPPVAASSQR